MAKTASARSKSAKGTTRKAANKGTTRKSAKGTTRGRASAKSAPKRAAASASGSARKAAPKKPAKRTTKSAKSTTRSRGASSRTAPAKKTTRSKTSASAAGKSGKVAKGTTRSRAKGRKSGIDVKSGGVAGKVGSFGLGGKVGSGAGIGLLNGKPGSISAPEGDQETPRLTRTKLNARDLRHFRELLLAKRRQLLNDLDAMENEALRAEKSNLSHLPVHMADMGTDNYEQEFTLDLVDRDRRLIDEIDNALEKIEARTFGICEGTGQMITRERLEAQPWARFSIEHARRLQRPGVRR